VFLGAKNVPVRDAVENAMRAVEAGELTPEEGWSQAVENAQAAAGS
jgi:cellobiose transport system substrate-binding protein